ncbi:hypothetical protein [Chromobacterium violaceum]|uniref:hypothetical protein n=1 Tax=Chromobacterium violaceum TaxID=536 RepID=UPI00111BDE8D|nr:hypothetical protein [Chromobacterium violaceum]
MVGADKQLSPADMAIKGQIGAVAGRFWDPKRMPDLNRIVGVAHADKLPAMKVVLPNGKTGWQILEKSIKGNLGE